MKIKKMLTPFLIAGFVLSAGSNSFAEESTFNESNDEVDWDKAWESFETENYPSEITFPNDKALTRANEALKYTNGSTKISYASGKVKSTGISQDGGIFDVISAQTSIRTANLSYIQGNYASTSVIRSSSQAISTVETTDLSGTNVWEGLTYHTVDRFTSKIVFTGYTSDSAKY